MLRFEESPGLVQGLDQGIHIAALLWRCGISKSGQVDGQYTNTLQHQRRNGANPMCPTAAATVK